MHGMGQRVGEASPARLDAALRSMRSAHGANMARHAKTILHGALALAVMANVLGANPIRDVASIKSNKATKGATALTGDQLRELLAKLRTSDYRRDHDLVDPITVLIATGLRRSELLGLRWCDFDTDADTITITGKVIRETGKGLIRMDETKTASGRRTLPLPRFAIEALTERPALRLKSCNHPRQHVQHRRFLSTGVRQFPVVALKVPLGFVWA